MTGANAGIFFKFDPQLFPLFLFHLDRRFLSQAVIFDRHGKTVRFGEIEKVELVLAGNTVKSEDFIPHFKPQIFGNGIAFYLGNFQHTDLLYPFFPIL